MTMSFISNLISRLFFRSTFKKQGKLWGHTDFASRVIWPIALADQPLFDFVERPQSAWEKVQSFGIGLVDKDLTSQVREHLQSNVSA
jgi:hypothetical protein